MEERLTHDDETLLMSSIRTGTPLAPDRRQAFVANTKGLLAHARSYLETCHMLADRCLDQIAPLDPRIGEEWKAGVVEEIQWWWTHINALRRQGKLDNWGAFRAGPFRYEAALSGVPGPLRVLNIGCGPRSLMGQATAREVEFVHMDPLAEAYNRMMAFLDAPGGGDIVFGAVELLDKLDVGRFHAISAKNCLDHAYDVPAGLRQMIGCLEDRGLIHLGHYENEAEAQRYAGFHQWNIEVCEGRIHVWSKGVSEVFDHAAFGLEMEVERSVVTKGNGQPHPFLDITLSRGL